MRAFPRAVALVGTGFFLGSAGVAASPVVRVDRLPFTLERGWEAADGDPVEGVAGLDQLVWRPAAPHRERAPKGWVRWYRVHLDLTEVRGAALAIVAGRIRDADRAYWNGAPIGGMGSFPPTPAKATSHYRIYLIPPILLSKGAASGTLALQVWHGTRPGDSFSVPLVVQSAEEALAHRSRRDQWLVLQLGVSLALSAVLLLFFLRAPREKAFAWFGLSAAAFGFYFAMFHSFWESSAYPPSITLVARSVLSGLLVAFYFSGLVLVVGERAPKRYRFYSSLYFVYAALALPLGSFDLFYFPTRLFQLTLVVHALDLFHLLGRAIRMHRAHARGFLVGHLFFALSILILVIPGLVPPGFLGDEVSLSAPLASISFLIVAGLFLWTLNERTGHYLLAALTDPGTGLWNRTALMEEIRRRVEAASASATQVFALMMLDLDRFKQWNDTHGHLAGDRLLHRIGQALRKQCRQGDFVARFGGDEFVVVLPDQTESSMIAAAERIRGLMSAICVEETASVSTGASAGVVLWNRGRRSSPAALIEDADQALYAAKAEGGGRTHALIEGARDSARED